MTNSPIYDYKKIEEIDDNIWELKEMIKDLDSRIKYEIEEVDKLNSAISKAKHMKKLCEKSLEMWEMKKND